MQLQITWTWAQCGEQKLIMGRCTCRAPPIRSKTQPPSSCRIRLLDLLLLLHRGWQLQWCKYWTCGVLAYRHTTVTNICRPSQTHRHITHFILQ